MKHGLVVFLSVASCLSAAALPALDLAELKKAGVLRVIVAADEQPERYNANAGEPGFDREILNGFARRQGIRLETTTVPRYNDRIPALLEGRGDIIVAIVGTPERRKTLSFTRHVLPARRLIVTHSPHPPLKGPESLAKEKVGMLEGTTTWMQAALDAGVPRDAIRLYPSLPTLFQGLGKAEVTATVMPVTDFGIAVRRYPKLQAGPLLGAANGEGWAVRPGDKALLAALDEHLGFAQGTSSWSTLVLKYFGSEAGRILARTP